VITILQIGYDELLLKTRALLLGGRGYRLISTLGNGIAFQVATTERIDLVLIGHCAPIGIRENAAAHFKGHYPQIPVVALRASTLHDKLQYADYNVTVEDPEEWLKIVAKAVSRPVHLGG
jgi:hypothetical protein